VPVDEVSKLHFSELGLWSLVQFLMHLWCACYCLCIYGRIVSRNASDEGGW